MTAFNPRGAHTLICVQSNRSVPEDQRECVCATRLPRMFRPDFEIEGPSSQSPIVIPWWVIPLACVLVGFIVGVLSAKGAI